MYVYVKRLCWMQFVQRNKYPEYITVLCWATVSLSFTLLICGLQQVSAIIISFVIIIIIQTLRRRTTFIPDCQKHLIRSKRACYWELS